MVVNWLIAVGILILTFGLLAFVYPSAHNITFNTKYYSTTNETWDLKKKVTMTDISGATVDQISQTNTFRIFYNIKTVPRTATTVDCTIPASTAPNFDCTTNTYNICTVSSTNTCAHPEFMPLLSFGNSLWIELLQAPDASRQGLAKTQLCVQTMNFVNGQQVIYLETFPLPNFPLQKWIMLTLIREGPKFDVYYNNQLQASIKTTNAPYFTATSYTISPGIMGLSGTATQIFQKAGAYTPDDVAADYATNTDTTGKPLLPTFTSFTGFSLCPSGNCFTAPTIRPANPLVTWSSPYS